MNRARYFNYIEEKLGTLAYRINLKGKLNILDLHLHSETFYLHLLNLVFGWRVKNINAFQQNVEAIDLIDDTNKLVCQVSATNSKQKVERSLSKPFLKKYHNYTFKFICISKDGSDLRGFMFKNPHNIKFDPKSDILDNKSILDFILNEKAEKQKAIYEFIKREIGEERNLSNKVPKLTVGIALVICALFGFLKLYDYLKSPKVKSDEATKYTGELKPSTIDTLSPSGFSFLEQTPVFYNEVKYDSLPIVKGILIRNKNKPINLEIGNTLFINSREYLSRGIEIHTPIYPACDSVKKISLILKDDRLYVSVEFKDLEKGETVGYLEYNHWTVFKENSLEYPKNDDYRLEVKDKKSNIVFTIRYNETSLGTNQVFICGYFISPKAISILVQDTIKKNQFDTCISKSNINWKQDAEVLIQNIKSIYPK